MADLQQTRRKLRTALIVMLAVDIIAVVLLLSPLVGSSASRQGALQQARMEARQKTREVEPLRGMDKKVVIAGQEIDSFYKDRLPTRESEIAGQFGKLASDAGVKLGQVKYDTKEINDVGLAPINIDANCQGDYKQLVRFINALERDRNFFIIDSVVLGDAQGGTVKLQLKVETYLRMT